MSKMPPCRTDDFQKAQWDKVEQVFMLAVDHDATILNAGDMFELACPSYELTNKLIINIKNRRITMYSIAGNHDLPGNTMSLLYKGAYGNLVLSEAVFHLPTCDGVQPDRNVLIFPTNYKEPLPEPCIIEKQDPTFFKIVMLHYFVLPFTIPKHWKLNDDTITAKDLIKKYSSADVILTGHNHLSFVVDKNDILKMSKKHKIKDTILINAGSLTRHKADQIDHQPCVFLLDTEQRTIERIPLEIEKNVISTEHLDLIVKRDARIEKYVTALCDNQVLKEDDDFLDYKEAVLEVLKAGKYDNLVKQFLTIALEKEVHDEFGTTITETEESAKGR